MKILLTGSSGFIGKNLLNKLLEKKYETLAIVRPNTDVTNLKEKNIKYFIDTGSYQELEKFFDREKFDGVVHLASCYIKKHVGADIENLINSNVNFAARLLDCATKNNCRFFINTGTFWQHYNNAEYDPVNLYAATKQAFEDIAKYYCSISNIKFITLKLNDTYGPGDTRPKILNLWKKIAASGEELSMSGGEQIIDIVYIDDVVSAYLKILELLQDKSVGLNSQYAISAAEKMSLKELAKIFEEVTQSKLNIKWGAVDYLPREVMSPWNDYCLVPGWLPKINIKDGISIVC